MASITKLPNGRYRVRWRDPGVRNPRSFTVDTLALARTHQRAAAAAEQLGERYVPRAARRAPRLVDLCNAYLRDMSLRSKGVSVRVVGSRLKTFAAWAETAGHGRSPALSVLSTSSMRDFVVHERGRGVQADQTLRWIQAAWLFGTRDDDFAEWTPPFRPLRLRPPVVVEAMPPTWAQMDAVVAWLRDRNELAYRAAWIMRCTGLRIVQVTRLDWSDFDLEAETLRVRGELGKMAQEQRGRTVPIAEVLVEAMAGWGVREGLVVPRTTQCVRIWIRDAWQETGAPRDVWCPPERGKGRPCHAFRAGFQAELLRAGAREYEVKALVGHDRGTQGIYVPTSSLELRHVVSLMPPLGGSAGNVESMRRDVRAASTPQR